MIHMMENLLEKKDNYQENKEQYGEILKDKTNVFHGIGFDFIRLKKILEYGILSAQRAKKKGVDISRNSEGFNLNNGISVTESPSINNTYNHGAFNTYIKNGISFVVGDVGGIKPGRRGIFPSYDSSGFEDEVFVYDYIEKEKIKGVMVPEEIMNLPLSKIPFDLSGIAHGYINDRCRKTILELKEECDFSDDTSALEELIKQKNDLDKLNIDFLEKDKRRQEIILKMEQFMQKYIEKAYIKKFNNKNLTFKDILLNEIPATMPLYNSNGFSIENKK